MNLHRNARTTPVGRAELVRRVLSEGQLPKAVATAFGVEIKTVNKWVARFVAEGPAGLEDRSSRPRRLREPTPPQTVERIIALRRQRLTGKQVAQETGVSPATVSRICGRRSSAGPGTWSRRRRSSATSAKRLARWADIARGCWSRTAPSSRHVCVRRHI